MSTADPETGSVTATQPRGWRERRATNATRGTVLAEHVEVGDSFWSRFVGLLGRNELPRGHGLLLTHCSSVHSLGMAFPIDVLYLDREGEVRAVVRTLAPWRLGPLVRRTDMVLELPAGASEGTEVGDMVRVA